MKNIRKILLVLVIAVITTLTSCEKEEELKYEGELFRIEMYTQSWFTGSPRYYKPTSDFNVVGGEIVEIENDYVLVAVKKNHSIQLITNTFLYCNGGYYQLFTSTKVDDNGNEITESEYLSVRCQTNSVSFIND